MPRSAFDQSYIREGYYPRRVLTKVRKQRVPKDDKLAYSCCIIWHVRVESKPLVSSCFKMSSIRFAGAAERRLTFSLLLSWTNSLHLLCHSFLFHILPHLMSSILRFLRHPSKDRDLHDLPLRMIPCLPSDVEIRRVRSGGRPEQSRSSYSSVFSKAMWVENHDI